MRMLFRVATFAAVAAGLATGGAAEAAFIQGSLGFTQFGQTAVDNPNFALATAITLPPNAVNTPFVNIAGTDSFAPLTAGTVGSIVPTTFTAAGGNVLTFGGFTFTILGGTIIPNPNNPNELSYNAFGTVTAAGFDPSLFTLDISVIRNPGGGTVPPTINSSSVLSAPGQGMATVPEPASLVLLGAGAVGLLGYARRRKATA